MTREIRRGWSNGSAGDGQELTLHFDRRAGRQAGHRGRCGAPPQEGGRQPWADRKSLTRDWLQQNGATVPSRVRSVLASQTSVRDGTENSQDLLHDLCSVSSRTRTTPESQSTENHLRDSFPILPRMLQNVAFPDASEDINSAHTTDTSIWQTFSVKGWMASVPGFVSRADCHSHSTLPLSRESSHSGCLNERHGHVTQHSPASQHGGFMFSRLSLMTDTDWMWGTEVAQGRTCSSRDEPVGSRGPNGSHLSLRASAFPSVQSTQFPSACRCQRKPTSRVPHGYLIGRTPGRVTAGLPTRCLSRVQQGLPAWKRATLTCREQQEGLSKCVS